MIYRLIHQLIYCGVFLLSLNLCGYSSHLILVKKLCLILYCACGSECGVCTHESTKQELIQMQQPNEYLYLFSSLLVSVQTPLVYEGSPPAFDAATQGRMEGETEGKDWLTSCTSCCNLLPRSPPLPLQHTHTHTYTRRF